mgnify:CR=1 FL=1|tara:strand:- start:12625 stop:13560 length:936 start_codon:yes stop_codon:yes gene_type:complete
MDIDFLMLKNMSNEFNKLYFINDTIDTIDDPYFYDFTIFLLGFIKLTFSLISGTFIAVIFVSYCIYSPSKLKFQKLYNQNKEKYDYDPFLLEYIDEYYDLFLDKDEEFLNTLTNKYIYYSFDFNNQTYKIIMYYNATDESFDYYLNNKSYTLPFDFLDTVSRIYSVKYNCRNIYIDNYDNKNKLLDLLYSDIQDKDTPDKDKDKDNDKDNDKDKDKDNDKDNIFYSIKKKNFLKNKNTNKTINYTSNKFKYKGLLKDFSDLILGFDIYDTSNNFVTSYQEIENDIFSIKKNNDFEMVDKNISFKNFKNSII